VVAKEDLGSRANRKYGVGKDLVPPSKHGLGCWPPGVVVTNSRTARGPLCDGPEWNGDCGWYPMPSWMA
jgi:hypothetical protein